MIFTDMKRSITEILQERFGDPIGSYAGDAPAGVRSIEEEKRHKCGMEDCDCDHTNEAEACNQCGFMEVEGSCGCTHLEEDKKGPSKKTAQKILKGTKTFKQKMKKVEKWADDPAAAAAWMTKKATGKWPSEE